MLQLNLQLFAHKKGVGSTKNGRDSESKRLGAKRADGQFVKAGNIMVPFHTWRNSNTQQAADALTELFDFNIPLRWTISHLYQCILNKEPHVKDIDFVTTLDSYITWKLTGEKNTGIGDASGIFPIDSETLDYDQKMMDAFDKLIAP